MGGLALRPAAQASTYAPPSYANPAAYQESEFTVGTDQWALPGILTMPVGPGPVPAVVLVHGSGPGDRDATVGQIKQFKDLALGLASRGIAVLRFDKRVRVHANAMREGAGRTVKEETIEDGPRRGAITRKYATRGSPSQLRARAQPWWYARAEASRREVADGRLHRHGRRGATLQHALVEQSRYLALADGTISPEERAQIDQFEQVAARVAAWDRPTRRNRISSPAPRRRTGSTCAGTIRRPRRRRWRNRCSCCKGSGTIK